MCRYHVKGGYCLNIFSVEFIRPEDGFLVPVGPIHPVFERGDGERMSKGVGRVENYIASTSIVITRRNQV